MESFAKLDAEKNKHLMPIRAAIAAYNQDKDEKDKIKFLHGGSSAVLAFVGKQATIFEKNKKKKIIIPYALIPTGLLRKKYGIYPISGELKMGIISHEGSRKAGVNYKALSGMPATEFGISKTYDYANSAKKFVDINALYKEIESLILSIRPSVCLRNLKLLEMLITNVTLLDPNYKNKLNPYLHLLENEFKNLQRAIPNNSELLEKFEKYYKKIKSLLTGKTVPLPFNETFVSEVLNQYPIIYCSTTSDAKPYKRGLTGEIIHQGELDFQSISIMFTPVEYVDRLKKTINQLGIKNIQIIGYEPMPPILNSEEKTESSVFLSDISIEHLQRLTEADKNLLKEKILIEEKIISCANLYLKTGDTNQLDIMLWILKKADPSILTYNLFGYLPQEFIHLKTKIMNDHDYIKNTLGRITPESYERFKQIQHLNSFLVILLQLKRKSLPNLLDHKESFDAKILEAILSDKITSGVEKLQILQGLHEAFTAELEHFTRTKSSANIKIMQTKLHTVEECFEKILKQLIANKTESLDKLEESDLFNNYMKKSSPAKSKSNLRKYLKFFSKLKTDDKTLSAESHFSKEQKSSKNR